MNHALQLAAIDFINAKLSDEQPSGQQTASVPDAAESSVRVTVKMPASFHICKFLDENPGPQPTNAITNYVGSHTGQPIKTIASRIQTIAKDDAFVVAVGWFGSVRAWELTDLGRAYLLREDARTKPRKAGEVSALTFSKDKPAVVKPEPKAERKPLSPGELFALMSDDDKHALVMQQLATFSPDELGSVRDYIDVVAPRKPSSVPPVVDYSLNAEEA